jgi:hypothetical protein
MKQSVLILLVVACVACSCATAQPAAKPADKPAPAATTAPTTQPAVDAAALKILDRLEKSGDKYPTLRADITYHVHMIQTDDTEERTGYVAYQKKVEKTDKVEGSPTKFHIQFTTLKLGEGAKTNEKVDYAFDGMWLTVAKHRIKNMTRYQVAAKGETIEPLRIGRGPFPLPFGQKTADMLKHFRAVTREPKESDPDGSDYLLLLPHASRAKNLSFVRLEMWIDRKTDLPIRVVSKDKSKNVTTVNFRNIETNVKFKDSEFLLRKPFGWKMRVEPLDPDAKLTP